MSVRRFSTLSLIFTRSREGLAALALGACTGCLILPASIAGEPVPSNQDKPARGATTARSPGPAASALPVPNAPAIPAQVTPRPAPQTTGSTTFHLTTDDRHISEAVRRLASAHGWQLSWEIDRDFAIQYAATFSGPFLDIVEQIARSLQSANTPIRVKAYHGNRVLRVLYATY